MRPVSGSIIASLGELTDVVVAGLRSSLPDERIVPVAEAAGVTDGEIVVTMRSTPEDLQAALATGARWVHVLSTGVDGVDLSLLRGVDVVTCSRGASSVAIAEFVLATMLAFEKQLPSLWISEASQWGRPALGQLAGKTLGLVGVGAIGAEVARRALAFDLRVVALRRRTTEPTGIDGVEAAASLPALLAAADHVVLAAPATPATHHLLDGAALAAIKPGAHVVNVSRGSLVDQDALRAALDDGRVACASLDTVEPEPLPEGHWLYTHPKVRLSPHTSWSAPASVERTFAAFLDNLARHRAGEPLGGVVDLDAGY
jgi:phosphoglycerate dehydrogenase-like enzyme